MQADEDAPDAPCEELGGAGEVPCAGQTDLQASEAYYCHYYHYYYCYCYYYYYYLYLLLFSIGIICTMIVRVVIALTRLSLLSLLFL